MSHIVSVKTQVRDPLAVRSACERLQLAAPTPGRHRLFSGEVAGLAVSFPGWRYPAVCDTASGQVHYDNYNGRWGEQSQLDRFLQAYAVEKTKLEARRQGHSVTEQPLPDGSIKLTLNVGDSLSS